VSSVGADPKLSPVVLNAIQPTEVLVEICASGICHTDLACMSGKLPAEFPNVLGHEGTSIFDPISPDLDLIHDRSWCGL
jgi:Zn-dependent alcohol dehydrogenase